jgi:2-keto-4-pentenoate hydratase/2-oxohepta-3-ene-1,7-dioic acid hydratase in catechol pathway
LGRRNREVSDFDVGWRLDGNTRCRDHATPGPAWRAVGDTARRHAAARNCQGRHNRQHATIDDLRVDIPTLIEYCSTFTQLEAGRVIVTGTTGEVAAVDEAG